MFFMEKVFAFLDGDNVGSSIELLLLSSNIDKASELSSNINKAMSEINNLIRKNPDINIIIFGGDDILIELVFEKETMDVLESIREMFFSKTGLTISCGIGNSIKSAIYNLNLAKIYGKNQTKSFNTL